MKKILYILLGILIALAISYMVFLNIPKASVQNKDASASLTSIELYDEYTKNENKANRAYNGKIIEVTGTVLHVSTDKQNNSVILLNSSDPNSGVLCTFEKKLKKEISAGNEITVKGQCNGLLMDVVLNKCIFVK